MLKKFEDSSYIGYKIKQVQNEPTEAYLFLIKKITKWMKNKRHVRIRTNFVKSSFKKTIGHVNKVIQSEGLEIIYAMAMWVEKDKQTLVAYDTKVKEKT